VDPSRAITEHRARPVAAPAGVVWDTVMSVGGPGGWGLLDPAWRLRGRLDEAVGGPGMRGRPRRRLKVGDAVDLWRVEELTPGEALVLRTEARMPGTAWMRLQVMPLSAERTLLTQDVLFEPGGPLGIPGRLMWFAELPGHKLVFASMVRDLARDAERRHAEAGR
jgi:hypothetical protein